MKHSRLKLFWKSFWRGFTFDTTPKLSSLPNTKDILNISDEEAIRRDWEAVGKDMQQSIDDLNAHLSKSTRTQI